MTSLPNLACTDLVPLRLHGQTSRLPPDRVHRGFTLIELMVTIAVAAILMALAAPSMTTLIGSNRIQAEAASLVGDMQFARAEAIKRGIDVTICPSSDGAACLATTSWHSGWMVFSDLAQPGVFDGSVDTLLKRRTPLLTGDTVVVGTGLSGNAVPTSLYVTFDREGFASAVGATTAMFKFNTPNGNVKAKRCMSVDLAGRLSTLSDGKKSMQVTC